MKVAIYHGESGGNVGGNVESNLGETEQSPSEDEEVIIPEAVPFGSIEDGKLKGEISSIESGKNFIVQMTVNTKNFDEGVNECDLNLSAVANVDNTIYRSNENRRTAYPEFVTVKMDLDKEGEKVAKDEILTYTITIANPSKIKTFIKVQDYLPEYLEGISVSYDKYVLEEEIDEETGESVDETYAKDVETEYDIEAEANLDYEIQKIERELNSNEVQEADIEEDLMIPAGKSLVITLKAMTEYVSEDTEISNHVIVSGEYIKNVTSNITKFTLVTSDYDDGEEDDDGTGDKVVDEDINQDESDFDQNLGDDGNQDGDGNDDGNGDGNQGGNQDGNQGGDNQGGSSTTKDAYNISGRVWIDENKDGRRQKSEKLLSEMIVKLYNSDTNSMVYDEEGNAKTTKTDSNGEYIFENIEIGNYLVLFEYDSNNYSITKYQNTNVDESVNSDAIRKEVSIDGNVKIVGLTDIIKLSDKDIEDIDMGIVRNSIFDLKLDKYVSEINVTNSQGTTQYKYNNEKLAKVEIHSKQLKETVVFVEYTIKVTNEGDIEAYANEIIDYLPEGMIFNSSYNANWSKESDGRLVNKSLSNELIEPGASKELKLVLIKEMTEDSTGTIKNVAEIGKSSNFNDIAENDSVANNKVDTEDDYSEAQVIISIQTGIVKYTIITIIVVAVLIVIGLIIKGKINIVKALKGIVGLFVFTAISFVMMYSSIGASKGKPEKNITIKWVAEGTFFGSDDEYYRCLTPGAHQCGVGIHYYSLTNTSTSGKRSTVVSSQSLNLTKQDENSIKSEVKTNYALVGPYKIKSDCDNSTISAIKINYEEQGETKSSTNKDRIVNSAGTTISNLSMKKNETFEFYLKVPVDTAEIKSVKVKVKVKDAVKTSGTVTYGYTYTCYSVGSYHENGRGEPTSASASGTQQMYRRETISGDETEDLTKSITFGDIGVTGEIKIVKRDVESNEKLKGAKFTIYYQDEGKYYNGDGKYSSKKTHFEIEETSGIVIEGLKEGKYTITETKAPNGYNLGIQLTSDKVKADIQVTKGDTKAVRVYNRIFGDLVIIKVDNDTDLPVAGIEFIVENSSGEYLVKNSNSTYSVTADINKATRFATNAQGLVELKNVPVDTYLVTEISVSDTPITVSGITAPASSFYKATQAIVERDVASNNLDDEYYLKDVSKRLYKYTAVKNATSSMKMRDYIKMVYERLTGEDITRARRNTLYKTMYRSKNDTTLDSVTTAMLNKTFTDSGFENADINALINKIFSEEYITENRISNIVATEASTEQFVKSVFEQDAGVTVKNSLIRYYTNIARGTYAMLFKNTMGGNLKITKKDADSGVALTAKFRLYTTINNVKYYYNDATKQFSTTSSTFSVSGEKTISKIPALTYTIEEVEAPSSYILDLQTKQNTATVTLGQTTTKNITNIAYGKVKVAKYAEGTTTSLANAVFELYKSDKTTKVATLTTGTDGTAISDYLRAGTYWLKEIKAPDNFDILTEWTQAVITNNQTVTVTLYNRKKVVNVSGYVWVDENYGKESTRNSLYKQDSNDNKDILLSGVTVNLVRNGTVKATTVTDASGKYVFENVLVYENGNNILSQYYIEFVYNGMTYTDVELKTGNNASKASESDSNRTSFNNKFEVIDGSSVNSQNDTGLISRGKNEQNQQTTYNLSYTRDKKNYKSTTAYNETVKMTANTKNAGYNLQNSYTIGMAEISNINFGLQRREQPQNSLIDDLYSVRLGINGYQHVYNYDQKSSAHTALRNDDKNMQNGEFNVGVKFENSFSSSYRRAIYEADINYKNNDTSKQLKAYMIYKIEVTNESDGLKSEIQQIVNYYDEKYKLVSAGKGIDAQGKITDAINYQVDSNYSNNGYSKAVITTNYGKIASNGKMTIYLEFELKEEAVLAILNQRVTLKNVSEILTYSTFDKNDKIYAGFDSKSVPGNANPNDRTTFEDDTDIAPSLVLEVTNARQITGKVFEDSTREELRTGEIRQGDGIYSNGEKGISGVKVTLKETVEGGKIYETTTDGNGDFTISGFIPGEYTLIYTWGDGEYSVQQYKGTIYESSRYNTNVANKKWYKTDIDKRYTDATDNYNTRVEIDNQTNTSVNGEGTRTIKMDSITPVMEFGVEYETTYTASIGDKYVYEIKNIDFGIVERARQLLNINKKVDSVKIIFANTNTYINAEVENGKLIGQINDTVYLGPTQNGYNGAIKTEVNSELIQGATMEIKYKMVVENLSEKDYIDQGYYLYGSIPSNENNIVKLKPNGVYDYLEKTLSETTSEGNEGWTIKTIDEYNTEVGGLTINEFREKVSNSTTLTQNNPNGGTTTISTSMGKENYYYTTSQAVLESWKSEVRQTRKENLNEKLILYHEDLTKELAPGGKNEVELEVSKILAIADEIDLTNQVEITSITKNGGAVPNVIKTEYSESLFAEAESVTVTEPTGENRNYVLPITVSIAVLVVLGTGILLLKKRVVK